MIELLLSLMLQTKAKLSDFCEQAIKRHVVDDDPWPHAEKSSKSLVNDLLRTRDEEIWRELQFRVRAGLVSDEEIARLTREIGPSRDEGGGR